MANVWSFHQIGTTNILRLEGYGAPFGRPRKQPLLVEKYGQKIQSVRYPGRVVPTRHILGPSWEEFELSGRWMDKYLTNTLTANQMADAWIDFISQGKQCTISWGNIVSYRGIVEDIELSRESPTEIAWKIKVLVDDRPDLNPIRQYITPSLSNNALKFKEVQTKIFQAMKEKTFPDWQPDIFDMIDGLISSVNSFSSTFLKIANQFDNARAAFNSEMYRLESSVRGVIYAIEQFEDTWEQLNTDSALFGRQADSDINFVSSHSEMLIALNEMTVLLAETLNFLDQNVKGRVIKTYTARDGDTWETISAFLWGDIFHANVLRIANDARYGELPKPGQVIQVPSSEKELNQL